MRPLIILLFACPCWVIAGPSPALSFTAATPVLKTASDEFTASPWFIYGPFLARDSAQSTDEKLFKDDSGKTIADSEISNEIIQGLLTKYGEKKGNQLPKVRLRSFGGLVDFYSLLDMVKPEGKVLDVFYACVVLHAPRTTDIYADIGYDDQIRGTANHEHLDISSASLGVRTPSNVSCIRLNEGPNLIVFRVINLGGQCGFSVELQKDLADAITVSARNNGITHGYCVTAERAPILNIPTEIPGIYFDYSLSHIAGGTVAKWSSLRNGEALDFLRKMEPGIYRGEVDIGGVKQEENVCIGDPADVVSKLRAERQVLSLDDKTSINFDALFTRMDLLLAPEVEKKGDREWEQKIAFTLSEIDSIIKAFAAGKEPFKDIPGLHIRAFRSNIDSQSEYYRIYYPENRSEDPQGPPLVVILPTIVDQLRPFIACPVVASHREALKMAKFAERYGAALLWPGYRTQPFGNPCDLAHIDEALSAALADYRINPNRIVIVAECSGGRLAVMCVGAWPERFAGVAFYDAVFTRNKAGQNESLGFERFHGSAAWQRELELAGRLDRFSHTPTYVLFDDAKPPGHGEIRDSVEFYDQLHAIGTHPRFVRRFDCYDQPHPYDAMIAWAVNQKRDAVMKSADMDVGGEKNMAQALAERFIVVEGTGGAASDKESVQRLSLAFQAAWEKTYFGGKCRVVRDSEVKELDETESNLVLIGNAQTNGVWRKLNDRLPVVLTGNHVRIQEREWDGDSLGIQVAVQHPQYAKRTVVLIGGENLSKVDFGTMDLSIDGWYAASVWKSSKEKAELVDAVRSLSEYSKLSSSDRREKLPENAATK